MLNNLIYFFRILGHNLQANTNYINITKAASLTTVITSFFHSLTLLKQSDILGSQSVLVEDLSLLWCYIFPAVKEAPPFPKKDCSLRSARRYFSWTAKHEDRVASIIPDVRNTLPVGTALRPGRL
jgi:hypothetical protein